MKDKGFNFFYESLRQTEQTVKYLRQSQKSRNHQKEYAGEQVDYSTELELDDKKTCLLVLGEKDLKAE